MATAKLRTLDTAKGLTPYELELINKNFFDMEAALNSIGAVTPGSTGSPPSSIPIDHGSLLNLGPPNDHHLQYLLLAGRVTGQTFYGGIHHDLSIPTQFLKMQSIPSSILLGDPKSYLELLMSGGNSRVTLYSNDDAVDIEWMHGRTTTWKFYSNTMRIATNLFEIGSLAGESNVPNVTSLINQRLLVTNSGVSLNPIVPQGVINNPNTATNVVNTSLGVIDGDYWVSVQMYVRTLQVGSSALLTLNWNDGLQARSFSVTLPLDVVTVQQNRIIAITKGAGNLTYSLTFTGVTTGRIDVKLKAQRMSA